MSIGIVIVNYNGEKFQNECIESIYESDYKDFKIIVVDSGSTDNSIQMLKEKYSDVIVLLQSENVGVAVGNNIGIRESIKMGMDFTLLLNNDVEISKDLLSILVKKADENTVTVPKIYYYDHKDTLWFAGGGMRWRVGTGIHYGTDEVDKGQYDSEIAITYAPTCCMLIHNSIFGKIGYIDESVFMYFDDTDLCVRIVDSGAKLLYVPSATMWHKVSSSSGGTTSKIMVYYNNRNHLYFISKYKDRIPALGKIFVFLKDCAKLILSPIRNKNDKYLLRAYMDYFKGKMGRQQI